MNLIRTEGVSRIYRQDKIEIKAVDNIDLTIEEGEFIAITGSSGSGKSTLLHLLGCIDRPTGGKVFIKDREVSSMNGRSLTRLRLHEIGFVFQQFYLLPALTAYENIELPMKESGVRKNDRKKRIMELLGSLGMEERARHRPGQLSGGEKQRVAIARALANDPSIILADEPTGELDSTNGKRILDILTGINREHSKTIVVVTHDEKVTQNTGRVISLQDGRIISDVR